MSKRGQMFSCLTTAIAGFVLLCPAIAGRAFGDFQLVYELKVGVIYGADQAGSTGNINPQTTTVSAQSTLDAVASGSTSSAQYTLQWRRQWQWIGDAIEAAHVTASFPQNLSISGSIQATAQFGNVGSMARTGLSAMSNGCTYPGCSYSVSQSGTIQQCVDLPGPWNNEDLLPTQTATILAQTAASVSVTGGHRISKRQRARECQFIYHCCRSLPVAKASKQIHPGNIA